LAQQPQPLRLKVENKRAHARDVAAGVIQVRDEAAFDWVVAEEDDNRYGCGRRLGCQGRYLTGECNDDGHLPTHQIGGKVGQAFVLTVGPTIIEGDVLTIDESGIIEASPDHRNERQVNGGRTGAE